MTVKGVRVDGTIRIFIIKDPHNVTIVGGSGETVSFRCGPQKNTRLQIVYEPLAGAVGIAGLVKTLEFR